MPSFYLGVACFLLATMLVGLVRVFRGPEQEDRVVAVQLFGTTGVAILLLLAAAFDVPAIRNAALVFALLAVLAVVAFVRGDIDNGDVEKDDRRTARGD
ncbi:multicomponent Na+:H+ antiporter subunit F [Desulfonatronum thiosulfatophilum]|uniref:Multicomponent Na+:H+ antiporter subunit F n=1 Tax=Desulfonatronum thiosulfatophilum TaxID=617002 RepID=A0A1G6EP21_9BACT|nr:monovalent cation/H+ antiporter complex subunit F [Desulfonatronum thiosulfatophilum]SDB59249.1 multicomponent Na+:H+ antiporter subunit F [Desulfonatronum thiosulfatophilum]